MMQGVHLVGEDEDDIYGGFDDYNPAFETEVGCEMKRCQQTDIVIAKSSDFNEIIKYP